MSTVIERIPPLAAGDTLTREEFMRRWEAMPNLKKAELIGGIVYMPSPLCLGASKEASFMSSPLRLDHGDGDSDTNNWLATYAAYTPGCKASVNATWFMLESAPQPDNHLRILPEYGGQSAVDDGYGSGAPELAAETCLSSASYDLNQKMELYRQAGVLEYITVLTWEQEVRWHRLIGGAYEIVPLPPDGIQHSTVFPGLWLDVPAFLKGDMAQVLATLQQGLQSPEHAAFVRELARRRTPS